MARFLSWVGFPNYVVAPLLCFETNGSFSVRIALGRSSKVVKRALDSFLSLGGLVIVWWIIPRFSSSSLIGWSNLCLRRTPILVDPNTYRPDPVFIFLPAAFCSIVCVVLVSKLSLRFDPAKSGPLFVPCRRSRPTFTSPTCSLVLLDRSLRSPSRPPLPPPAGC